VATPHASHSVELDDIESPIAEFGFVDERLFAAEDGEFALAEVGPFPDCLERFPEDSAVWTEGLGMDTWSLFNPSVPEGSPQNSRHQLSGIAVLSEGRKRLPEFIQGNCQRRGANNLQAKIEGR
jgi:hypothetical protein